MESMQDTINNYKSSIKIIKVRIDELTKLINKNKNLSSNNEYIRRRYLLYSQIGEMTESMKSMQEYLSYAPEPKITVQQISFLSFISS